MTRKHIKNVGPADSKGKIVVTTECLNCHKESSFDVKARELSNWLSGGRIQDVMPSLSVDQREQLINGTCPTCWDIMFGELEE